MKNLKLLIALILLIPSLAFAAPVEQQGDNVLLQSRGNGDIEIFSPGSGKIKIILNGNSDSAQTFIFDGLTGSFTIPGDVTIQGDLVAEESITAGEGVTATAGGLVATTGNIRAVAGDITAEDGEVNASETVALDESVAADACSGTVTANGTTAVAVNTTCATTGSRIFVSATAAFVGGCWANNIVNGVSFDIDCVDAGDTGAWNWIIFH